MNRSPFLLLSLVAFCAQTFGMEEDNTPIAQQEPAKNIVQIENGSIFFNSSNYTTLTTGLKTVGHDDFMNLAPTTFNALDQAKLTVNSNEANTTVFTQLEETQAKEVIGQINFDRIAFVDKINSFKKVFIQNDAESNKLQKEMRTAERGVSIFKRIAIITGTLGSAYFGKKFWETQTVEVSPGLVIATGVATVSAALWGGCEWSANNSKKQLAEKTKNYTLLQKRAESLFDPNHFGPFFPESCKINGKF